LVFFGATGTATADAVLRAAAVGAALVDLAATVEMVGG
jgi:hypothetical protein